MMSGDTCHGIFYQFDGEDCAHRIKDFFSGRRYKIKFSLHELQHANITNVSNPGVFILLLTPDSYDLIQSQKHLDLNAIFPNPEFSVVLLFHVEKTKTEITTLLSPRIRDFSKWMVLEYSSLSTLGIDIMDLVEQSEEECQQQVHVWPREGVKSRERVLLIFINPVDEDSKVKFIQKWDGLKGMAERFNPMTFCFTVGDVEPGERKIEVLVNDTSFGIVVLHVLRVEPKMEEISKLLHDVTNPIELLCQCLHIVPSTRENIDQRLLDLLSNNNSSVSNIFAELNWKRFRDSSSNYELPTLLHFGAKYGFKLFCMKLLGLPECKQALKIKNKDGLFPCQIAQKEGFDHLALVLQNSENDSYNSSEFGTETPTKHQINPKDTSWNYPRSSFSNEQCPVRLEKPVIGGRTSNLRISADSEISDEITPVTQPPYRRMTNMTAVPATRRHNYAAGTNVPIAFGKMKSKVHHYETIDGQ